MAAREPVRELKKKQKPRFLILCVIKEGSRSLPFLKGSPC
jgi:hypothetical protein